MAASAPESHSSSTWKGLQGLLNMCKDTLDKLKIEKEKGPLPEFSEFYSERHAIQNYLKHNWKYIYHDVLEMAKTEADQKSTWYVSAKDLRLAETDVWWDLREEKCGGIIDDPSMIEAMGEDWSIWRDMRGTDQDLLKPSWFKEAVGRPCYKCVGGAGYEDPLKAQAHQNVYGDLLEHYDDIHVGSYDDYGAYQSQRARGLVPYADDVNRGREFENGIILGSGAIIGVMIVFCMGLAFGMVLIWGYGQKREKDLKMYRNVNEEEDYNL
eukprot:269635_1